MKKLHFLAALAFLSSVTACKIEDPLDDGFDSILDTNDEAEDDTTTGDTTDDEVGTMEETAETAPTTDETAEDTTDTGTDTDCAPGTFGCPCNAGACDMGLECVDDMCQLGGMDTDDTTDTDGADPWDPATCMEPSQVLMVGNLAGNFCAAPCMGAMDPSCPAGPMGTFAQCALTTMQGAEPSFCALICMVAQDSCPAGSTCKDLMDPMNPGLGLCTYP